MMSNEQKMREALESVLSWDWQSLRRVPESPDWPDALQSIDDAAEALAQPAAGAELTDEEIEEAACGKLYLEEFEMVRRVIAAHEAKKNGSA